jgi:hypothetical protein
LTNSRVFILHELKAIIKKLEIKPLLYQKKVAKLAIVNPLSNDFKIPAAENKRIFQLNLSREEANK